MSPADIRTALPDDRAAVMDVLLLSFSTDPCMRYTLSSAASYMVGFPVFASGMGGAAFDHGTAYVSADGGAASLWLPPGVEADGAAIGAAIATVGAEKLQTLGKVVEAMGQFHPHEPHWYLAMVGADPTRQGQGLGSAMLKHGLAQCDAQGMPAYLESSNPRNTPLYERHGFEVMGIIAPDDFPPMTPMYRPARR